VTLTNLERFKKWSGFCALTTLPPRQFESPSTKGASQFPPKRDSESPPQATIAVAALHSHHLQDQTSRSLAAICHQSGLSYFHNHPTYFPSPRQNGEQGLKVRGPDQPLIDFPLSKNGAKNGVLAFHNVSKSAERLNRTPSILSQHSVVNNIARSA
jgi:hypothetical protein